jgi:Flp pilus assembly protein TadG
MTLSSNNKRKSLRTDTRGAVLAEFVVAIFPLLTVFFVFVQISAISVAKLLVKHSAVISARAAAVYANGNKNCPECQGDGAGEINNAAKTALVNWKDKFASVSATVTEDKSTNEKGEEGFGPYGLVTVTVRARYKCEVPVGKVICPGGTLLITETKSMPHQGARYKK